MPPRWGRASSFAHVPMIRLTACLATLLRSLALAPARPRSVASRRVSVSTCLALCLAALVRCRVAAHHHASFGSARSRPPTRSRWSTGIWRASPSACRVSNQASWACAVPLVRRIEPPSRPTLPLPGPDRRNLQAGAEAAIERAVTAVLRAEGIGVAMPFAPDGDLLFPPVSFAFVAPPKVLIVSPRDRIRSSSRSYSSPR